MAKEIVKTCCLSALLMVSSAVTAKEALEKQWENWDEVGEAQLTVFIFDVYQSRLLTPSGEYISQQDITPHPLALNIQYQRDISSQQLLEATEGEWEKLGFNRGDIQRWSRNLAKIFPDIKDGQELTYVTDGNSGRFYYNPAQNQDITMIGEIANESLNDAFLSIWLSPDTSYPELRKQLIGKAR
ncbi:chalcone isomerase family protein [Vibrio sonorensis]|uniref:chalcone isomerase family protein n=1 Tax=Vibrio sonorensis TaxID=1004316 RepID=UPI0008D95B21|nr:chalcone isomerase family protein [Vibrio sonorensis]